MAKRDHLKNYLPNEEGGFDYIGLSWTWQSAQAREGFLRSAALYALASSLFLIAAGFVPAPGSFGAFYVVIPYAAAVVGMAFVVVALIRIGKEGMSLRDHVYEANIKPLFSVLVFVGACVSISGLATLVHALLADSSNMAMSAVFALCALASGALSLLLAKKVRSLSFSSTL